MKRIALILALFSAAASAQQVTLPDGTIREGWPVMVDGAIVAQADLIAAGAHLTTDAERDAAAQISAAAAAQARAALLVEIAPVASMMKYALVAQFGTNVFATVPTVQQVAAHFYGKRMAGTFTALDTADWDILNDGYAFIVEKLPGGVATIPWGSIP